MTSSEATPLLSQQNQNNTNGTTTNGSFVNITHYYTDGDDDNNDDDDNGGLINTPYNRLQISLRRSASTFSEAMTNMKRIGYLGSMSIAVNSLTGPAM